MKDLFLKLVSSHDPKCSCAEEMARQGERAQTNAKRAKEKWFEKHLDSINKKLDERLEKDSNFYDWITDVVAPSSKNNHRRDKVVPLIRLESFVQSIGEIILCLERVNVRGVYKICIGLWYHHSDRSLHTVDWSTDPSVAVFLERFPRDKKGLYSYLIHTLKKPTEFLRV